MWNSLGMTANVKLQLAEPTWFCDVQMKNPEVSLEMLNRDRDPSSATQWQKLDKTLLRQQSGTKALD